MKTALVITIGFLALTGGAQAAPAAAWDGAITQASTSFAIPAPWIRAVIQVESAGDPKAVSRSGAMGLMQLMPATWSVLRQRLRLGADPFDPRDNIVAGTALLRELYDRFGPDGFLAAYNAGPARYLAFLTRGQPLTEETRTYLARIAPLLGDAVLAQTVSAPAALPDWRNAPLFITATPQQPEVLWAAARPAPGGTVPPSPAGTSNAAGSAIPSRLEPQSGGIFATISRTVSP